MEIKQMKFFHTVKIGSTEILFLDRQDGKFDAVVEEKFVRITDNFNNTVFTNINNVIWFTVI